MDLFAGIVFVTMSVAILAGLAYKHRGVGSILFMAFILRLSLALVHIFVTPLPDSQGDSVMFERIAWELSQGGIQYVLESFKTGAFFYPWLISFFYYFITRSPFMIQVINCLLGSLVVYNVYALVSELGGNKKQARVSAFLVAIFPTLVLYSSLILRETIIIYFLSLACWSSVKWWKNERAKDFLITIVLLLIAGAFHTGVLFLILPIFIAILLKMLRMTTKGRTLAFLYSLCGFIGFVILLYFVWHSGWGLQKISTAEKIFDMQQGYSIRGRTGYLEGMIPDSPIKLFWQTPIRLVFFLFTPFVWWLRNLTDLIGILDALLYLMLSIKIAKMLKLNLPEKASIKMLVFIVLFGLSVFAIGTSNYGTAIRHRAKFAPAMIAIAVLSLKKKSERESSLQ